MNTSGVSWLASRLKQKQPSAGDQRESIQLTDSAHLSPVDQIRSQLESLISQTNAQERALLRYHAELCRKQEELDDVRLKSFEASQAVRLRFRVFLAWRREGQHPSTPRAVTPAVFDSVNLNDTLRNLAMSLASPLREANHLNTSTSTVKSLSVPFQTVRTRPYFPSAKA
jgi:hypothetical protein